MSRGPSPSVRATRRVLLGAVGTLSSPLSPDRYLELINPLWCVHDTRGRIVRVEPQAAGAATLHIKPGLGWAGHQPGQYLRLGVDIDGVRHWRAYSLTSEPGAGDGLIGITPKRVDGGKVSRHLVERIRPGAIVCLGGVEGTFTLPAPLPPRLLFLTAGSGITPVMSMLRTLRRNAGATHVVHLHSAPTLPEVIFGVELGQLARQVPAWQLQLWLTREQGRLTPTQVQARCPDWSERVTFASGPRGMLDTLAAHWEAAGIADRLRREHFQPAPTTGETGAGGTIVFRRSGRQAACDGSTPILLAGERAGAALPFGCRMGICHTCVGRLRAGRVRDLRTGEVHGEHMLVRTCLHAPEGRVEIDL